MHTRTIAFVAAGSGGHVQSALATYEVFIKKFPNYKEDIFFVGTQLAMEGEQKQSLEERLCFQMQIPFVKITGAKLQRQISLKTVAPLGGFFKGLWESFSLLRRSKTKVVVAFGGYSSLPMGIAAWLLRIPLLIHEQTTSIGLTNNILQYIATKSFITYPESFAFFKNASKTFLVGSPTRQYVFNLSSLEKLQEQVFTDKYSLISSDFAYQKQLHQLNENIELYPLLFIMGGSQGSHIMNTVVLQALPELAKYYSVFIQTGENQIYNDFDTLQKEIAHYDEAVQSRIIVRKFIYEEIGYLYSKASLFIGRSGANTVYEVGMFGIPSLLVPIPWVTRNEQYTNAQKLVKLQQAIIISQEEFTSESLLDAVKTYEEKLQSPSVEGREKVFPSDSAEKISEQIAEIIVQ